MAQFFYKIPAPGSAANYILIFRDWEREGDGGVIERQELERGCVSFLNKKIQEQQEQEQQQLK